MTNTRRTFLVKTLSGASALTALAMTTAAQAQAPASAPTAVLETSEQAVALGYKADATKVDAKKHPNRAADQMCAGCTLYQGKAGDSVGSCAVFGNNLVAGKGWCGAWTKKG